MQIAPKVSYQASGNLSLAQAIENFSALTFPNIVRYSQAKEIVEPLIGISASVDGKVQGLLLAENKGRVAKILTWFVNNEYRHVGIGTNLVLNLEKVLLKNSVFDTMVIDYDNSWSSRCWLEKILTKQHWKPPQDNLWMCATVRDKISEAEWLDKAPKMAGIDVFLWQQLTLLERQQLLGEKNYPDLHDPFKDESRIAFSYSYGLRYENKIIGWLITHQISSTAIQYSNFFIEPAYQKKGYAIALLIKTINQQIKDKQFERFVFQIYPESEMMLFMQKRLEPHLSYKSLMKSSFKILMRT